MEQVEVATEKPKRTLSPEHLAKMKEGRQVAAAERRAKAAARVVQAAGVLDVPKQWRSRNTPPKTPEFLGLTKTDCPVDCTPERCAIGGSLVMRNQDGTTTLVGHCTHPCKGGLGPVHMSNPLILARYNRARKYLGHLELDKRP